MLGILAGDECDQTELHPNTKRKTKKLKTENPKVVCKKKTPNYYKWSEAEETFKNCLMIMQTYIEYASPIVIFKKIFSEPSFTA